MPSSHTLPLTMVKQARLSRSSIRNILLALDIGDGCRQLFRLKMVYHVNLHALGRMLRDAKTDPYQLPEIFVADFFVICQICFIKLNIENAIIFGPPHFLALCCESFGIKACVKLNIENAIFFWHVVVLILPFRLFE